MTETPKKTKRRNKPSQEALEIAEAISVEVAAPVADELEKAAVIEDPAPKKEPAVEVAVAAPAADRPTKIKATTTMRGQVGKYIYNIKAGETYTLPASVAHWLIGKGRAI